MPAPQIVTGGNHSWDRKERWSSSRAAELVRPYQFSSGNAVRWSR